MNLELFQSIQANLMSPAVLFFVLGIVAALVKSDLRFPEPLYVALTIYLLVAIGFKGGVSISNAGLSAVWLPGLAAIALGILIPLWTYPILRLGKLSPMDAASLCGHYGSVSAVTFIAATNFLREMQEPYEEFASAFLAVMESPAIVVGVLLGKIAARKRGAGMRTSMGVALHESLLGRSVVLLIGGLVIGFLSGQPGLEATSGFFVAPFQGILALFLLEMGTVAARRFRDLRKVGMFLLAFGILAPVAHGFIGVVLGKMTGLSMGGAMIMGVLAASASYIAAPAAMRLSLPEANPTLSLTCALAITFPFNITLGLPLYYAMAQWLFGVSL
jgi:uncharacterized protein